MLWSHLAMNGHSQRIDLKSINHSVIILTLYLKL